MRRLAIVAVFLAAAGAVQAQPPSDQPVGRASPTAEPPFRCDSLVPEDCLVMFERYRVSRERALKRLGSEPAATRRANAIAHRHTPSSRIICTSMPSRKPRSATRSRSQGNARRIASRMAQPASTKSARSAPMQGLATRSW